MAQGFTALSMEAVAERAAVSKATIYRRASSKAELVIRAIESMGVRVPDPVPDTGSLRGDLHALAEQQTREVHASGIPVLTFPRVVAEAALSDPELHKVLKQGFVEPRTRAVEELVRRGIERGDVRAEIDVETTVDLIIGGLIFVGLRNGLGWTEEPDAPARVVDTLLAGIGAS